jgi:mannose-1-phosphate guanylyltransferase
MGTVEAFHDAFIKDLPEVWRIFSEELSDDTIYNRRVAYEKCPPISFDYGILEKNPYVMTIANCDFGWSDLGTWGSLQENSKKDAHNNACIGNNIKLYETRNCIIHTTQEKKVVVQGLDGYIVAEKNDKLLICRLTEEQRIKDFAEE